MNDTDLLDFYAGLALVGLITKHGSNFGQTWFAEAAFLQASMMLEERKKHVGVSDGD
jgi:hypothetical protein